MHLRCGCRTSLIFLESGTLPTLQPVELILYLSVVQKGESFNGDHGVNQTWKNTPKRIPVTQVHSMYKMESVCRGSAKKEELGITSGWLETWDRFDSTSWKSPESLIEFIGSCISCNWEVSFCIVSWFSQLLHWDLIYSNSLRSVNFSHFGHISFLSISEKFFLPR